MATKRRSGDLNEIEREVTVTDGELELQGIWGKPLDSKGVVIFAHGSGSGRLSPRNNFVARELQKAHLSTLLLDLLTEDESLDRSNVFDIKLLAQRLILARAWASQQFGDEIPKIGYFGASTGAGAALVAAALEPEAISAVVSRGGRPDLAGDFLPQVKAPTLLIVGGEDGIVIDLNQDASVRLQCKKEVRIIPGAEHLFEEPGTLEQVASLATQWFSFHLAGQSPPLQKKQNIRDQDVRI